MSPNDVLFLSCKMNLEGGKKVIENLWKIHHDTVSFYANEDIRPGNIRFLSKAVVLVEFEL